MSNMLRTLDDGSHDFGGVNWVIWLIILFELSSNCISHVRPCCMAKVRCVLIQFSTILAVDLSFSLSNVGDRLTMAIEDIIPIRVHVIISSSNVNPRFSGPNFDLRTG